MSGSRPSLARLRESGEERSRIRPLPRGVADQSRLDDDDLARRLSLEPLIPRARRRYAWLGLLCFALLVVGLVLTWTSTRERATPLVPERTLPLRR
jgi:hypothetical protein